MDEDLFKELEKRPLSQNANKCLEKIIPVSCETFYKRILADQPEYKFADYFSKDKKGWDITTEEWKLDKKLGYETRMIKLMIPVTGVPFVSSSRCEKFFEMKEKSKEVIEMNITNKSLDVPYGNSFSNVERWTIISPMGGEKAIFRISTETIFT